MSDMNDNDFLLDLDLKDFFKVISSTNSKDFFESKIFLLERILSDEKALLCERQICRQEILDLFSKLETEFSSVVEKDPMSKYFKESKNLNDLSLELSEDESFWKEMNVLFDTVNVNDEKKTKLFDAEKFSTFKNLSERPFDKFICSKCSSIQLESETYENSKPTASLSSDLQQSNFNSKLDFISAKAELFNQGNIKPFSSNTSRSSFLNNKRIKEKEPSDDFIENSKIASLYSSSLKTSQSHKKGPSLVNPNSGVPRGEEKQHHPICQDERLTGIDPKMIDLIMNEVVDNSNLNVTWEDIAGLSHAKSTIQEIIIWPMLRPDLFNGLRQPPKGLLLFGPPGTGKTLIGKCVASQCRATFFSISASSLTSKWVGEGEKMVRTLFSVARCCSPAVVFIDEIDSILTQRTEGEFEASRRIKTEFLVQFDGAATPHSTSSDEIQDRILIIGATNRPQELDEAARRRLVKRLYIPLPDEVAREKIIERLLKDQKNSLTPIEISKIVALSDGYSGSDMHALCREASMYPLRESMKENPITVSLDQVRPINLNDFLESFKQIRASVSSKELDQYVKWNITYGSLNNSNVEK